MARSRLGVDGEELEAAWQSRVEGIARFYGWRIFHAPDNTPRVHGRGRAGRQSVEPGYPDLTLVRPPRLLFVELKRRTGRTTPAQDAWLDDLRAVAGTIRSHLNALEWKPDEGVPGIEVYVWRPADFAEVNAVLYPGNGVRLNDAELA